ncbi:kinase-like protein [Delitschia confertaspora ATCC 74209]|uniref:non-specific serine/threonine protein kinase n=1 Tax=Delitschia confertaspora ATCC 74209 TaxID=1513339 RepID=A0A9P4JR69_9PLEO|nr:kinase-like protein [Delitschia confertaspora ATCC 74209]
MPDDEKYEALEKIGHGSFGVIRKVRRRSDKQILCRKEISYSKMSQKEKEQLQAELSILKELRHPNIVAYYEREHLKESQDLYLYMEFCGNGDLGRTIRKLKENNQLADEMFVWSILSQIVSALYRCHYGEDAPPAPANVMAVTNFAKPKPNGKQRMILHRDLKPENVFLGQDNSVKLGDFGLSKILQSHDFASTYVGTPFYMSPEICKAEQYTLYSDIWALGCIVYELCAKTPPFNAKTHFDLIQKIKSGRYPPIPSVYSLELQKVIASCLQVIPHQRPDTAALLNLPIVNLMRKEQEAVNLNQNLKLEKNKAVCLNEELQAKIAQHDAEVQRIREEIQSTLRREWEVKARLEIDRQVALELSKLRAKFEEEVSKEVEKRVAQEMAKINNTRLSTSPNLAPRSLTPILVPTDQGLSTDQRTLFPVEAEPPQNNASTSTIGTSASDFPSGTDLSSLSSLSLDSPDDTVKAVPAKKPGRAPLSRARTMFTANAIPPPSPMDVQMSDPSPAPAALASLALSPRRAAPRANIFAAAKEGRRWEPEVPSSPTTDEAWSADLDDDDDLHVLPSPTRARSGSGNRNGNEDPFKVLAGAQRPIQLKGNNRLASAPNLAPKCRPVSSIPAISSPERRKKAELPSPTRKVATKSAEPPRTGGLMSKKGNEQIRIQAMRNNGIQGRTLVELQQARGIPTQAMSEDEGKRGFMMARSPAKSGGVKTRSANGGRLVNSPAKWDPEKDDMPSPFLVKSRKNFVV